MTKERNAATSTQYQRTEGRRGGGDSLSGRCSQRPWVLDARRPTDGRFMETIAESRLTPTLTRQARTRKP